MVVFVRYVVVYVFLLDMTTCTLVGIVQNVIPDNSSICEICSRSCIYIGNGHWYCTKCRIATTIKLLKSIEYDYRDGF
jgi:tRNA(Ile2) C34 agmatinyltransferase TiaS